MNEPLNLSDIITKKCVKCKQQRRFVKGKLREIESICGNCWDWTITDEEYLKKKDLNI